MFCRTGRQLVIQLLLVLSLVPFGLARTEEIVTGTVFEDKNQNGVHDAGEPGIADVSVSNQIDVVKTNQKGKYVLPIDGATIIFITKPPGYEVPLNEHNLPQFYYIHQPSGSPRGLKFQGIEPTGALPTAINFPLKKTEIRTRFKAIISGDPQPRNEMEVNYFRDDIVTQMIGKDAEFYLALGDLADNNLSTYEQYSRAVAQIGVPAFHVPGNADLNARTDSDDFSLETYRRIFGPPNYSFEYGKVHFVVLDNVEYFGWDSGKNQKGSYRGYLSQQQLLWLKNDLGHVPDDFLVVIAMHIPIATNLTDLEMFKVVNRKDLFEVLKRRQHLLAVFGHAHIIEHLHYKVDLGWPGEASFRGITAGAACGAWWTGPKDARGIPASTAMDGSPNGFFVFSFEGNRYNYHFYPSNGAYDAQMRISQPRGILSADSLSGKQIIVNIFNASPESEVTFCINDAAPQTMQRTEMKDPFLVDYVNSNREILPTWLNVYPTGHIWKAPLPEGLKPGTHTIRVKAIDHLGNIYRGVRLFEIGQY